MSDTAAREESCGFKGFSPRFTCRLAPGHDGNHDYGFLPTATSEFKKFDPRKDKDIAWDIEEGNRPGVFDVFVDRRAGAYDLDLQGAVAFVMNHRSYRPGHRVNVVDRDGRPIDLR